MPPTSEASARTKGAQRLRGCSQLAAKHGAAHEIRPVSEAEVRSADELWITSSGKEVLPIVSLDGQPVGHGAQAGQPGPLGRRMHQWFCAFREEVMRNAHA